MAPAADNALPQWVGSIQDDFSLQGRGSGNYSVAFYHPWGAPGVSAAVAIVYSAWVTGANALLVAIMLTCPRLLNSRQNILVLHVAIVDLTVGLFYCPLTADFYIRGQWTHGCDSFFVWFIFLYPQVFLSVHLVGVLNGARFLSTVCPAPRAGRWVKNVLFAGTLMLLWFYLIMIGASLDSSRRDNFRIAISKDHLCRALVASDGAIATNALVFFAPASLTLLLWLLNVLREKTSRPIPRSQLQLDCETEQNLRAPLPVLSAVTLTSCLLPLPAFLITTTLAAGGCASATCLRWAVPLSTLAEWVLFSKAGVLPLVWLLSPDFKGALLGAFHHFRRVPTSDTRDLVESEAGAHGAEGDDTPFSEM
ncbi:uncharacterized protein LOC143285138 [Babylonia areolata]|uniref:uncharacterized protein LOC143285138 n=1 Tax=Babylonia areolata TaxID=304850 RepID=UPI003FD12A94